MTPRKFKNVVPLILGLAIAVLIALRVLPVQARSPTPPTGCDICAIVNTMPDAENTDQFLSLLDTSRSQITTQLIAMKNNMEQYNAEGYGWQNVIDGSSALEPKPGTWLIGALKMACESSSTN